MTSQRGERDKLVPKLGEDPYEDGAFIAYQEEKGRSKFAIISQALIRRKRTVMDLKSTQRQGEVGSIGKRA